MIYLDIEETYADQVESSGLEKAAQAVVLSYSDLPDADLTIVIDGDERLHELNNEFLGIDAPTDVLSFPSGEEEPDPETGRYYLGDIVISYPRAAEQAAASDHPVSAELALLVVHGSLHLLGFDHAEPEEKALMWSAQKEILQNLGVPIKRLPD